MAEGKRNELNPPVLKLSPQAVRRWCDYTDKIERECGPNGGLAVIKSFASKMGEQVCRMAAVSTLVADLRAEEIHADMLEAAIMLGDWYLDEALRLAEGGRTDPKLILADKLLQWCCRQRRELGQSEFIFRDILQFGPGPLRTKAVLDETVRILLNHGWLVKTSKRPLIYGLVADG
jgi:hypothetical protein